MNLVDFLASPWAIVPEKLLELQAIYATHLRGEKIDIEAIEARLGRPLASEQQEYRIDDSGVAVLSISGVIANKANMFTRISGGASAQLLEKQVNSMRDDPRVRAAVIDIDSPGGSVFGIPALGEAIKALAAEKPTVAVSTGQMASAAYWLGSAANAVYMSGTTDVLGSIGVVAAHTYNPKANGPVTTEITAGKYKRIASDSQPLSKEGRAYLQAQVDHLYSVFVDVVAENRRVNADAVLAHMADGRVFIGQQAIDAGLADGIATVDQLVAMLAESPDKFATRRKARFAAVSLDSGGDPGPAPTNDSPVPAVESTAEDKPIMTPQEAAAQFAKDHPEAHSLILAAGASAERDRIAAVRAQLIPGHEALVEKLAADGSTTGEKAAMLMVAAERERTADISRRRLADVPAPVAEAPAPAPQPEAKTPDERWEANADLRGEFGGDKAAYLAYEKARAGGRFRLLTGKTSA